MTTRRPLRLGDVVLAYYPFTDLTNDKLRPALVLSPQVGDDVILAFMTSRTGTINPNTDVVLAIGNTEFAATGLRIASVIRLNKLATLHRNRIVRRLGQIGPVTASSVSAALRYVFQLQ
jgi:mRNA interferase MazF